MTKKIIQKKTHPLEIEDHLFGDVPPFTKEELDQAKKSLFPNKELKSLED